MLNQINLGPISQFAQLLRAAELGQNKEVKMTIQQARLLNLALTEIQDKLLQDYETLFNQLKKTVDNEVVSIEIDGGTFKD
jgi:acetolactate synthase regulatory subunit